MSICSVRWLLENASKEKSRKLSKEEKAEIYYLDYAKRDKHLFEEQASLVVKKTLTMK